MNPFEVQDKKDGVRRGRIFRQEVEEEIGYPDEELPLTLKGSWNPLQQVYHPARPEKEVQKYLLGG